MRKHERAIHKLAREHGLEVRRASGGGHFKLFSHTGELVTVVSASASDRRFWRNVVECVRHWSERQR